ncbi:hypothetical protein RVIR1_14140 [Candidatus Rickettsiella viridis]|uniref:Uncharacterized protein n=1 Tax=Candidatus Rickettsiella viridis TaxID=676208 RepID=A0A2Z5UWB5_9COXI|nr:hypothetical protein RVIR1_14140 [Candidatus Rickettsiella viridis]
MDKNYIALPWINPEHDLAQASIARFLITYGNDALSVSAVLI